MALKDSAVSDTRGLRPVTGLTRGLPTTDLEILTANAIRQHRSLVERADQFYQALPEEYQAGKTVGGQQHLEYIEAMIEMHAQMGGLNALLELLGYIPNASMNR